MSALPEAQSMTEAEYLAFEREQSLKHEYIAGEVYAMTGASIKHNLITASVIATLIGQTRGNPCSVLASDTRVKAAENYVYPDVSVVCGEINYSDDRADGVTNPVIVLEVLSPSTERYDRGKKFQLYREITSLQEYILVAQDAPHIEQYVRQDNGTWALRDAIGLEATLTLPSIDGTLALADVYAQVTFEEEA